ncbi:MAG: fatty acid desaturase [Bdellovibrionales bacterium]|nr:fatty acid desaturase [Bdellovibrionales bacterium]
MMVLPDKSRTKQPNALFVRHPQFEALKTAHFVWDFFSIWVPIGMGIYLSEGISIWFYPLSFMMIAHRQIASALMGHEGAHGLLAKGRSINNFLGRYLFHFPALISHSRYKSLHLLHHRYLGEPHDPDTFLYEGYPQSWRKVVFFLLRELISGRSLYYFANYFTEIPMMIRKMFGIKYSRDPHNGKSDFIQYSIFWLAVLVLIHSLGVWKEFLLYWIVPVVLSIPWIQFQNALEHGAIRLTAKNQSRSISHPALLVALALPKNLNYHFEHHANPHIPHYNLPKYSIFMKESQLVPPEEEFRVGLGSSLKQLFSR